MKWQDAEKEGSNLMKHALVELEKIGYGPGTTDAMEIAMQESILEMVHAFSKAGHSGSSGWYAIGVVTRLLKFENLKPLTNDPMEWTEVGHNMWQNRRNSKAFSADGGLNYWLLDDSNKEAMYQSEEA